MIAYTYQHDIDRSKTDKIIFYANKKSLVAIEQEPPIIKFYAIGHTSSSNKVLLLWHLPKKEKIKLAESGRVWHALQTHNWLKTLLNNKKTTKAKFLLLPQVKRMLTSIL